ncbi:MAG: thioredoxin family protein [Candidatus Bipolaricaulia bacterium]
MKVEVLGSSGCSTCEQLKQTVKEVVGDLGKEDEIEILKVEDPAKFASYSVMSTPALVVDGEVEYKGTVPTEKEIRSLLS